MTNQTSYVATKFADLDSTFLELAAQGVSATCAPNSTTNIDLTLTNDVIFTGAWVVADCPSNGDHFDLQILSGKVVIKTPISTWYPSTSSSIDLNTIFPIKIPAGLTLRIVYTTVDLLLPSFVAANYKLHTVLV